MSIHCRCWIRALRTQLRQRISYACVSVSLDSGQHTEKKTAKLHAMDEKRQTITKEKTRTKHVDMKWTTKQIFIFLLFFSSSASRLCIRSSLSFALDTIASVTHTKTKNVLQVITLFMCIVPVMLVIYSNGKKDTEKKTQKNYYYK